MTELRRSVQVLIVGIAMLESGCGETKDNGTSELPDICMEDYFPMGSSDRYFGCWEGTVEIGSKENLLFLGPEPDEYGRYPGDALLYFYLGEQLYYQDYVLEAYFLPIPDDPTAGGESGTGETDDVPSELPSIFVRFECKGDGCAKADFSATCSIDDSVVFARMSCTTEGAWASYPLNWVRPSAMDG